MEDGDQGSSEEAGEDEEPARGGWEAEAEVEEAVGVDDAATLLDDAGAEAGRVTQSDFNRAQRFKKLFRLLTSTALHAPTQRFGRHAAAVMAGMTAVHVGMFVFVYTLFKRLEGSLHNLDVIGQAAVMATDIAVYCRALNMLYEGMGLPSLRLMAGPQDIPAIGARLANSVAEFEVSGSGKGWAPGAFLCWLTGVHSASLPYLSYHPRTP